VRVHGNVCVHAGTVEEEFGHVTTDPSVAAAAAHEPTKITAVVSHSAVVDVEGRGMGNMGHTLADAVAQQLKCADGEPVIAVMRGSEPVSEYNNPDLLCGLRPDLFPFGVGGLEDRRGQQTPCSYQQQVAHCLELVHGNFRENSDFLAMTFNTLQKRQTCLGAHIWLQKNQGFGESKSAAVLANLTPEELLEAVVSLVMLCDWFQFLRAYTFECMCCTCAPLNTYMVHTHMCAGMVQKGDTLPGNTGGQRHQQSEAEDQGAAAVLRLGGRICDGL
jgi:hypothetical protein